MLMKLWECAPAVLRDCAVTVGSTRLQVMRRGGAYSARKRQYENWHNLKVTELLALQELRLQAHLEYAATHSRFYQQRFMGLRRPFVLEELPILEKRDLHSSIEAIVVREKKRLIASFTGGTTGRGITVFNTLEDLQERFAILDLFWAMHGFQFGQHRVAWFSGRNLLSDAHAESGPWWRNNWLYKVRYYSTFHMSPDRLPAYIRDLCRFKPEYLSGFPSALAEIASCLESGGAALTVRPKAIFATSETLLDEQRVVIERAFGCKVRNQYCASEGAPFIVECPAGNLHLDCSSGVIEVIDESGNAADEGEVLVTPFFAKGTPIIRYRIGDRIRMSEAGGCPCGWETPLVAEILGRTSDYVEIPGRGKIFCSQIGDCVKGVSGVLKFQVEVCGNELHVKLVADLGKFTSNQRATFLNKIRERMGNIPVVLAFVDNIPRARSGKHSVVARTMTTGQASCSGPQ